MTATPVPPGGHASCPPPAPAHHRPVPGGNSETEPQETATQTLRRRPPHRTHALGRHLSPRPHGRRDPLRPRGGRPRPLRAGRGRTVRRGLPVREATAPGGEPDVREARRSRGTALGPAPRLRRRGRDPTPPEPAEHRPALRRVPPGLRRRVRRPSSPIPRTTLTPTRRARSVRRGRRMGASRPPCPSLRSRRTTPACQASLGFLHSADDGPALAWSMRSPRASRRGASASPHEERSP